MIAFRNGVVTMRERKELNVSIGQRIHSARENAGITQEKLSEKIDTSVQYISDLERGVTGASVATLIKICKTLSVSSDYLLMGDEGNIPLDISKKLHSLTPSEQKLMNAGIDILLEAFHINDSQ